jgi:group II intron reverse transcriptase/maturase/CRISPR-associated endonuclease Cas1
MHPSLLEQAADLETLRDAWGRIAAKGARGGIDQVTVTEFGRRLERNLATLHGELLDGRYVPVPLLRASIPKGPGSHERRVLGLPAVRDKVAQEAVRSVIEPILDRQFLGCSYGYRPRKGPHRAIARVTQYLTHGRCRWAATADIDDFFGSLSQSLLLQALQEVIPDPGILRLVELWIRMGTVDCRGRWRDVPSGVHQGAVISPLLANLYLHPFDRRVTEAGHHLVRYADDFILLCPDRPAAEAGLALATTFLESRLGLRLNPDTHPIASLDEGFTFLGIRFLGDSRSVDPEKLAKIQGKLAHLLSQWAGDVPGTLARINAAVEGWRRYYGSLVGPPELEKIDALIAEAASILVREALTRGTWKDSRDAEACLGHLQAVVERDAARRRAWIAGIVRAAKRARDGERMPSPPASRRASVTDAVRVRRQQVARQHLQGSHLWVLTPGSCLGKTGERVVVRKDRRTVCEVPTFRLSAINVAAHGVSISSDLINHCAEHGVPLLVLSPLGELIARLDSKDGAGGRVALRQLQALHEGHTAFDLARRFVLGKLLNQAALMKYLHKYHKARRPDVAEAFAHYTDVVASLKAELRTLALDGDYELGRGRLFSIEGRAAQPYWDLVRLILAGRVAFPGRDRQGARDLVNSLLNYGYAVLRTRVALAAAQAGLSLSVSFLHALRDGKPTLTYDLIEEFRPQAVDRPVLAMINRGEPVATDNEGRLTPETRRLLIARIQDRLGSLIRYRGRQRTLDEIIHDQARVLAHHLMGEATYRPFIAKW